MFFNESYEYGYGATINVQPTETGLTPDLAGAYRLVSESTEEWYNLREKMMKVEHVSIIREDAQLLNEGASDFFGKISGFFKKMLAKIKEMWQKFIAMINSLTMKDKDFVKKYEKIIRNKSLAGFEVKCRKWKEGDLDQGFGFDDVITKCTGLMSQIKGADKDSITKLRETLADDLDDEIRGMIVGGTAKIEAGDFNEKIREKFFDQGDTDAEERELTSGDALKFLDAVKDANKNIKAAQKAEREVESLLSACAKFFDGVAKDLTAPTNGDKFTDKPGDKAGKTYASGSMTKTVNGRTASIADTSIDIEDETDSISDNRNAKRETASLVAGACRRASSLCSTAFGAIITAVRERRNEYRSILSKMATYKPKSESYEFGYSESSILDMF